MEFNTLARRADLENVNGNTGPVYFGAKDLHVHGTNEISAEDFWLTTCDLPEPHYRLRVSHVTSTGPNEVVVQHARLQVGRTDTPLYLPRYAASLVPGEGSRLGTELTVAGNTALGTYLNVAQWFEINENLDLAPRLYATAKQGVGFGFDGRYDYMNDPSSPLYRSTGEMRTLLTTEDNGYTEWYHRQELTPDTVMLFQSEQWYERDVIKDFYSNDYENRTGPRTFLSVAHTRPEYMATGTIAPSTHDFTNETEKLPELTFHMFERQLAGGFYATFDTYAGYYETEPSTVNAGRSATVGRISYDWNVARGFNVLPFVELHGTYYSRTLDDTADDFDGTVTTGVTVQSRLQRNYPGFGNFTGFKHIIIPSTTLSYRPDATIDAQDLPQYDALDQRPGRVRVETTLDNILLGKNAANNMVWPVGRLTFYTGTDLENEAIKANDYEIDLEIRPRPSWGMRTVAEIHDVSQSDDLPGEDFNRVITYGFYDNRLQDNSLNARAGFAFTESGPDVLNEEILYGLGYKFAKNWSFAFDHRYDFNRNEFTRQTYTLRRKLHDWEIALLVRDRQDSLDIGFSINLVDFPEIGTGL
jgi:lipopolysaccharide assembly outer membrane protein LptD (OstA)